MTVTFNAVEVLEIADIIREEMRHIRILNRLRKHKEQAHCREDRTRYREQNADR